MSESYSQTSPKSDKRGIDDAIREAIENLNQTHTADLAALFLTGEEESKARALFADNADRERLSEDLKQLGDALRRAQPTQLHSRVEAELRR